MDSLLKTYVKRALHSSVESKYWTSPLDAAQLDHAAVAKLTLLHADIEMLDQWILSPFMVNASLSDFLAMNRRFQEIQPPPPAVQLYRGFDPRSSIQDTAGLGKKGVFFNSVLAYEVGHVVSYATSYPLSFTTDVAIARGFGPTVVELASAVPHEHLIFITNELSWIIHQRRKLKNVRTQSEVVYIPMDHPIDLKVIEKH